MLRAVLTAVALGIIVGQATLDLVFPEEVVTQGYDPATWKPCPGRKPTKWNKRRAVWYCGPSASGEPDAQSVVASGAIVGQGAASRRSPERTTASRATAARGGR